MMPNSSKYYVANFLDSTISVIKINQHKNGMPTATLIKTINLLEGYNPLNLTATPPTGALPIQIPVSPDGKYAIVANTLAAKILVIDTITDTIVKSLDCDAGCHGVAFGAKAGLGGGYYAYVSSKFSNRMIVVDPDPNGGSAPNNGSNAAVVGSVLLTTANPSLITNDFQSAVPDAVNAGMGGQGVLPIPLVYNGFVQNLPTVWCNQLSPAQRSPIGSPVATCPSLP
jgi:DNA-binding beta-propeller fold protein YncE